MHTLNKNLTRRDLLKATAPALTALSGLTRPAAAGTESVAKGTKNLSPNCGDCADSGER